MVGHLHEYEKTLDMLESIEADLKLVIAGNHDISLDADYYARKGQYMHSSNGYNIDMPRKAREMWTGERAKIAGVTYLAEGTHTFTLKNGARLRVRTFPTVLWVSSRANTDRHQVYASPFQPEFCDWAFPYFRHEDRYNPPHQCTPNARPIAENPVPDYPAIDVMMTHGPPMGILDETHTGEHVGCQHLLRAARRCRPRMHCFGHIHEGWGAQGVRWKAGDELDVDIDKHVENCVDIEVDQDKMTQGRAARVNISEGAGGALQFGVDTLMINASIMDITYKPWNGPWLVDMDLEKAD